MWYNWSMKKNVRTYIIVELYQKGKWFRKYIACSLLISWLVDLIIYYVPYFSTTLFTTPAEGGRGGRLKKWNYKKRGVLIPLIMWDFFAIHLGDERSSRECWNLKTIKTTFYFYFENLLSSKQNLFRLRLSSELSAAVGASSQCYWDELMLLKFELML